jgi:hypothetical protein
MARGRASSYSPLETNRLQDLGIDGGKAAKVVADAAKERKRTTLVQAISFLRQKKVRWAPGSFGSPAAAPAGGSG